MVFLHGLLADKREYLATTRAGHDYKTIRWSNVWFASRGYAVLNYSARGHGDSGGEIELASRHVEVRDARHLISLLTDDTRLARLDRRRVGVIGSSYGGGQAWLLMTTRGHARLPYGDWRSPRGHRVRLAAVVPGYTWTDMVQSLVPNGRQRSTGVVDPRTANTPIGVAKITLINGFLATAGNRLPEETYRWLARASAGEPYDGDPQMEEAKRALSEDRSAYFQDGFFAALRSRRQRSIPVLAAQGWTDPIFSTLEAVRMRQRLRTVRRGYPIALYLGDFEHLTALVKLRDLGTFHDQGTRFLDHYLRRRGKRPRFDVRAAVTNCDPQRFGPVLRARSWAALHPGRVRLELPGSRNTVSPLSDPRGPAVDPVTVSASRGRGCITTTAGPTPGVATWTVPVDRAFTLAGMPRLRFRFRTVAPDITLNSRLWDVAPDGTQTLVSRGAWRTVAPAATGETVDTELFGAAWRFEPGHSIRLEVTQVDATYLRPNTFASSATVEGAELELPAARER